MRELRRLAIAALLPFVLISVSVRALYAQRTAGVRRVAIDWKVNDKGSAAVRDHIVARLKTSKEVQVATDAGQADATLHGGATLWKAGTVLLSPRSKSVQLAILQGFVSVELTGKDGKTLWSYLATPRSPRWKSITDDLADQVSNGLLEVISEEALGNEATVALTRGQAGIANSKLTLSGAGATFPAPVYQRWFQSFTRTRPEITIQYDPVGSSEGIRRFLNGATDFGASDMPLADNDLAPVAGGVLQLATVLGAVVPIYNVTGAPDGLNLSPEVLAGIFLGRIRTWDAPEIRAINKHVSLPSNAIVVVHRSDGSGTTYAWTEYLSKVSDEWKANCGAGAIVKWPVGIGAERNEGVADLVRKTPNSIGYVEFIYALQHELNFAAVRNRSGEFVKADLDSMIAAAKTLSTPNGSDFRTSVTNAGGKHAYPIAAFTWILVPAAGKDPRKQEELKSLLQWMLTSGQRQCAAFGYAPLPREIAVRELQVLAATK